MWELTINISSKASSKGSNERLQRGCKIQLKKYKNLGISPDVYLLGGLKKVHTAMQVYFYFKQDGIKFRL